MRYPVLVIALMVSAPAMAADLSCGGPPGGHTGSAAVCDRLAGLLAGSTGAVRLELTRDESMILAGRLVWQSGGRSQSGPVVEVTAQDRPLDTRAAERLARGLIAVSDLP